MGSNDKQLFANLNDLAEEGSQNQPDQCSQIKTKPGNPKQGINPGNDQAQDKRSNTNYSKSK